MPGARSRAQAGRTLYRHIFFDAFTSAFRTLIPFPLLFCSRTGPVADTFVLVDWFITPSTALSWSEPSKQAAKAAAGAISPLDVELTSVRVAHEALSSPVLAHARAPTPRALTPEPLADADSARARSPPAPHHPPNCLVKPPPLPILAAPHAPPPPQHAPPPRPSPPPSRAAPHGRALPLPPLRQAIPFDGTWWTPTPRTPPPLPPGHPTCLLDGVQLSGLSLTRFWVALWGNGTSSGFLERVRLPGHPHYPPPRTPRPAPTSPPAPSPLVRDGVSAVSARRSTPAAGMPSSSTPPGRRTLWMK